MSGRTNTVKNWRSTPQLLAVFSSILINIYARGRAKGGGRWKEKMKKDQTTDDGGV
jgi:hypothetical protein